MSAWTTTNLRLLAVN